MEIRLASSYGFCFGVKRAIKIAEKNQGSATYGPLIHNKDEINRLKSGFDVHLAENMEQAKQYDKIVIRTHGIPKDELAELQKQGKEISDATCPFVTTPQKIVEDMSKKGYSIVIFGDANHPEIKGVKSYAINQKDAFVILNESEIDDLPIKSKVAIVAQTTRKPEDFAKVVSALLIRTKELRVFNTICNATFENQDAAASLSQEADIMIVIGGKNSSNTKQLYSICKNYCDDSYLIENEGEISKEWFKDKKLCGISAGASTPDWVVQNVIDAIESVT